MYKCQVTGKFSRQGRPGPLDKDGNPTSIPGEKLNKIVVATRPKEYKHWDRENEEEWFSHGTEIVKEINASDEGVRIWNAMTPEEREEFVKGLA